MFSDVSRIFAMPRSRADRWFWIFFLAVTAGQLVVLFTNPLGLSPDEAHYWEWSKRLDWSYYSKGPLIALFIRISTLLFGDTTLGVRFFAPALTAATTCLFYVSARSIMAPGIALCAAVALRTSLLFIGMAMVMTTDPLLGFLWMLALLFALKAVREDRPWFWTAALVSAGAAALAKDTAIVLFVSFAGFLWCTPRLRRQLASPGFVLGSLFFGLLLVPMLYWNARHGWVNAAHNAGHLLANDGLSFRPLRCLEFLAGQFGVGGLLVFLGVASAVRPAFRVWRRGDDIAGVLLMSSLPLFVLCVALSCTRPVYANWAMPAYLGGMLLMGYLFPRLIAQHPRFESWGGPALVLNLAVAVLVHFPMYEMTFGLPARVVPMKKLSGWERVSRDVEKARGHLSSEVGENVFVLADNYDSASALAFYGKASGQTYCSPIGRRMNQFDVWGGLDQLRGKTLLVVLRDLDDVPALSEYFTSLTPVEEAPSSSNLSFAKQRLGRFYFYIGRGFSGAARSGAGSERP